MKYPNVATLLSFVEVGTMTTIAAMSILEAVFQSGEDISDEDMAALEAKQTDNHARVQALLHQHANTKETP